MRHDKPGSQNNPTNAMAARPADASPEPDIVGRKSRLGAALTAMANDLASARRDGAKLRRDNDALRAQLKELKLAATVDAAAESEVAQLDGRRPERAAARHDRELMDFDDALQLIQALEGENLEVTVRVADPHGRLHAVAGFSGPAGWIVRSPASGGEIWRVWLDGGVPGPDTHQFSLDRARFDGAEIDSGAQPATLTLWHQDVATQIVVHER